MTRVRFMGGPMMNKRMDLTPSVMMHGRFEAAVVPPRARVNFVDNDPNNPATDIEFLRGYYKPSKNPEVWTWVGPKMQIDPYKSYERKLKKWQKEMSRLYEQGVYANTVLPPRPEFPR
jgi:hypothetical protein